MSKVWKIVLAAAAVLFATGVVLGLAGWFTGASTTRMIEVVFGSREALDLILQVLKQELSAVFVF